MTNAEIITSVAGRLGIPPQWLDAIIAFESNYNPNAVSGIAYNQALVNQGKELQRFARGLIQFTDSTAQWLGFTDAIDLVIKNPDFVSQMENAVFPYLQKMSPFTSESDFYMAIFFPAYRKKDPSTPFPAYVVAVNPGIRTPQDYINRVHTVVATRRIVPVVGGLALALIGTWFLLT